MEWTVDKKQQEETKVNKSHQVAARSDERAAVTHWLIGVGCPQYLW
jgi:hypothetical protein